MPRVVPSEVVNLIDKLFPWAKDQQEHDTKSRISIHESCSIAAVVELTDNLPTELLTITGDNYAEYISSIVALRNQPPLWQINPDYSLVFIPGLRSLSPVTLIRQALSKCPDEWPSLTTRELLFVTDSDLRENFRLDISAANSALTNGEWKAATVLAGSIVEALLLWGLQQKNPSDIVTATAKLSRKLAPDLQKWVLPDFIDVAEILDVIAANTATQCRLAKDFRNLIHPGRVQRLGQSCSKGTALSALAAVEHVANDFEALQK